MKSNEFLRVNPGLRGIAWLGLSILCTLLLFTHLSFADDFTAHHLGDYGNVTVMEVTGNFDSSNPDGSLNVQPRQVIAKEFFRLHKDEYDFVTIFTNFDYTLPPNAVAYYTSIKNDVQGIGQKIFDNSNSYGSNGKLQGTIDMWNLLKLVTNPLDPKFDFTTDTLVHETLHRWGAYVKFKDWNGVTSDAILGYQKAHWSFLFDSGGSTHLGNKWRDNGDGTFTSIAVRRYYSPLDLYLMGMIDKSKVPPTLLIDNPAIDPAKMPEIGDTISGIAHFVKIDDIIAVQDQGERVPNAKDSQKQFKMAFIYAVTPGSFKADDLYGIEAVRNAYLTRYSILTDGKALVQVTSIPRDDLPVNPGVIPPTIVPRTLPPDINNGVTWLLSRQQADGSWTDYSLTTERDTAEAVTTLQSFPSAVQSFQNGFTWLVSNASANTDFLARRIETSIQAGKDSSALVHELVSRRNRDGGWGSGQGFISTPADTALALKALALAGFSDVTVTGPAIAYLQGTQNPDGGWSGDDVFSTIQPTTAVLTAFNSYRGTGALDANITKAVAFLASKQNTDGGFGNSPSTIYDSALAVIALQATGTDKTMVGRGIGYLQAQQTGDGSWFDSPYQTALAVRAVWAATVTPDLSIKPEDLVIIPDKVTSLPTNVVLSANVSNMGRTDVLQAKVAIYDGAISPDKRVTETSAAFPGLSQANITFSIPVTDNRKHVYYVVIDPGNLITESDKDNNSATISLTPDINYDFKVSSSDITATPNPVDVGKDLKISVKLSSASSTDAFNVPIRIFINQIGAPFEIAALTADIPAGGSVVKETVWKATHSGADMPLTVQIDPNNTYTEISKDNNSASIPVTVSYPALTYDFSVASSDIAVSPSQSDMGKDVRITFKISNGGSSDAYNVPIRLFINQAGSPLEIATLTADIPAGGSVVREAVWKASCAGINMPLTVQIDPNNTFTEISKNNNSASVPLTVNASTLPNLSVSYQDMVITPSPAREGGSAFISVLVKNDGYSTAENVKVNVYLGVASNGGVLLGSQVISSVPAGQSVRTSVVWNGIAVNGSQLITVQVAPDDPDNTIREITKDDNFTFMNLDVLSLPDLAISTSSIAINPAMPNSSDKTISVVVTVQNGGDQEARDVPVQLKEGGAVIGNTVIPLVNGNSQATGTISYVNAGQTGSHQITVTVDPNNSIVERTKDNNSAVKAFSIQDANLWLTEAYISPDGDGVKDTTDFSFRLDAPAQVSVRVINKKSVAVRTFSGGELDNTAGSTVTWDGKNDAGSVVSDGTYKIQVISTNGKVLASLPVEVDTNRSPLADALGTKYLLKNNQTCMLPPYDRMTWLPNESGLSFQLYPAQDSLYLEGLYAMSPTGDDILRLIPGLWNSTTDPNTQYTVLQWDMTEDGQKIAFVLRKKEKNNSGGGWSYSSSLWIVNTDGSNIVNAYDFTDKPFGPEKISWSPDGSKIAVMMTGLYLFDPSTKEMKYVASQGYTFSGQMEWSPDSSMVYAFSYNYFHAFSLSDLTGAGSYYQDQGPSYGGTALGWLWDKKILFTDYDDTYQLRSTLFDAKDGTFFPLAGVGTEYLTISPDKRFIAWADTQGCNDCVSHINQISVMDSARNVTVIAQTEENPKAPNGAKTGIGSEYVWSRDGSAIAYINTRYNSLDSTFSDELVIHDMNKGTDQRIEVSNYVCVNSSQPSMAKAAVFDNISSGYCYSPKKISRIVAWMKDKINFLLETTEGIFSFNSDDQTSSDYLPIDGSNFLSFSPNERYLTYEKYNDSNSGCFPKWQNQWAMSSLLNLTADLRLSKSKSYVTLRGIASDKNFDGYRLEYADIKSPGTWNLIAPPSDVQVLNSFFTAWVPPYEGSFLVRLTVWDKAGNQAVDRKRLNWGMSSLITNLYKTEEYISPNSDGNKKTVELHYQVLEPVHLEFNVYDDNNSLVRSYSRDYAESASDFISWNGKDAVGKIVPDGHYRISVFDYDFFVTVDATSPNVAIELGKFAWSKSSSRPSSASVKLLGLAFDVNIKRWEIESGIGDNPQTWFALRNGNDQIASLDSQGVPWNTELMSFDEEEIGSLKGVRIRITAEDYAGNQSRKLSDFVEEGLEILAWDGQAIVDIATKGGLLPPAYMNRDTHSLSGVETYRLRTVRRVLQYQIGGQWIDGVVQDVSDMNGSFFFEWNTSNLNTDLITALRIKIVDESGDVHYKVIGIDRQFDVTQKCESTEVFVDYNLTDELESILLQFSYDNEHTWNDLKTTKNRNFSIDCRYDVPLFDINQINNYYVRAIATSKDGVVRTETLKMKNKCVYPDFLEININVAYEEATICNTLAPGKATVGASVSGKVAMDSFKLSMKAPEGERLLKDCGKLGDCLVVVDTSGFPEGTYPVTATLAYTSINNGTVQHGITTQDTSILVSRTLPHVKLTYPPEDTGQTICPVRIKYGDPPYKYGVNVAGVITGIVEIGHYELMRGSGASPGSLVGAQRVFPKDLDYQIRGTGAVNGNIDAWDVTGFRGDTYSLQLQATDAVGNKSCSTSTFYLNEPIKIASITPSRPLISSVSGYSLDAGYQLTGPATIGIKVFPVISAAIPGQPETLGEPAVRSIASDVRYLGGVENTSWDGTRDGGAILPDGKYGLTVTSLDACQLTDVKWADIEIDNTPPAAAIGYPRPIDPLPAGNIIEVKGTATDQHFMSYLLEAGEGGDPASWVMIKGGTRSMSDEKIAAWNTFGLKDIWTLRLTAVDMAGNTRVATSTINLGARKELIKSFVVAPDLISPNNDQKRDTAHISYEVTDACQIKFDVLNSGGSTVKTIVTSTSAAGQGSFDWDGKSATNDVVADGVYTVRMYASLVGKPEVNQTEILSLTVDKVAPQIIIPIPADKSYYNKTDMPIIGAITDQNLDNYSLSVTGPSGTSVLDSGSQNRTGYTFGRITDLSEDTYTLTAIANDLGEIQTKLVRTFTIDRTSPKAVLDTPKSGDYYGAAKNVIDISGSVVEKNLDRFSLRYGAGEAPTEWKEVVGGDTVPTASRLSSMKVGKSDGIADGLYTFSLYARDKAGLEGEARAKIFIDNTPPRVAITLPRDGGYVTKALDIKGTAADTYFDTGTIELAEGSCATAAKWAATKTMSAQVQDGILDTWKVLPADGDYCLRLTAIDKSGNKSETKTGIKIDTRPPAAPLLSGKTDNKSDAVLTWTKNTEPDLAGYNLYRNSQKVNTALLADITYRDPALKEGAYVYSVRAVDFAGNESDPSNSVSLKIDLTGPSVRITSPGNATTVSNLIDIKGTAYSQDDFKEYRLYIGQGSNPSSWTLIRRSPLAISYGSLAQWDTITSQEGAQFTIKLEGEDLSGNISSTQATVAIDNTPPKAPVLLSATGAGADVALAWRANTEADLAGYLLYRNDQLANVTGIVAGNLKPYLVTGTSYTDKALPDGTYRYYLAAMDQAGNTSDQSNTLEVDIDTHPPHMTLTAPVDGRKFDGKLTISAETTDNDIASVQFQYKQKQDSAWTNLGTPFAKPPYITYLDSKSLNLAFGDYQIQALATDRHNKADPTPTVVTVTYTDLTPPDVPSGLAAKVNGANVNLTWNAVSETGAGYNVYRWNAGTKTLVTSTPTKNTSYLDSGVADGTYQYEITAIDAAGNESKASEQAAAKIYAPVIIQPYTPLKTPALTLEGNGVDPATQVQVTTVQPSGDSSTATVIADASGSFRLEGINLALGVSRFTALATDSAGNISRNSDTSAVAYGLSPAAPTGLAASVTGYDVNLTWNANSEPAIIGYNLFRDGVKVNVNVALTGGVASASSQDYSAAPQNAIDGNVSTYWGTPYGNGTFTPAWWQMSLTAPELISRLDITWQLGSWDYVNNKYIILAGKDYEIQGWSGYNWVTLKKVVGNDQQSNTIDISPSYRTDRIRIVISSTTDPNYSKYVRINEIKFTKENLIASSQFTDAGLIDHRYAYTITAVNQYGFESDPSTPVSAAVGDLEPPGPPRDLSATVQGSDVTLSWNPPVPVASDLATYYVYRQTSTGWSQVSTVPASSTTCAIPGLPNGTYRFRTTAIDAAGNESSPSNEAEATVSIETPKPPVLAVSSPSTGGALDLVWQGPSGTGPFTYHIYRAQNETGPFSQVNSVIITGTRFRDFGLTNGTTYYYRVRAVDVIGNEGESSNTASGVPRDVLSLQPMILRPTTPGTPLVVNRNGITVGGLAEPGARVTVLRDSSVLGSVGASAQDVQTDTAVDLNVDNAALSPDGQTLAVVDYSGQLRLRNMKSGETVFISTNGFNSFTSDTLQWSSDGHYLLASVYDYYSRRRIALCDRDLAQIRLLTTSETQVEWDASWSPAGETIVFAGMDGSGQNGIWKAQAGNSGATLLADNINNPAYPRLSADGTHIAFFDDGLYLLSLSDSSISLLDDDADDRTSAWSPDGSKLAYVSYRDGGNGDFYQMTVADGTSSRLTYSDLDGYNVTWSPDGKQLAYAARGTSGEVVRVAPQDSSEREMPASQDDMYGMEWRPNGELLYLNKSGIHTISPIGTFSLPNAQLIAGENRIIAVATDSSGNQSDPSEAISVTLDTGEWPDLAISGSDITLFPPYPKPGEDVLVTARIHNPTGNAVDNAVVELYLWDGSDDLKLLTSDVIQHLAANGEESVSVRFNAGTAGGTRTVIAAADPSNLIQEVLETNNYASKDLVVTAGEQVSISTSLGSLQYGANQDVAVGVSLMNSGTATTGTLKVMIEDNDGNLVKQLVVQPQDLAYGLDLKLSFAWNTGATYAGSYKAHALVSDSAGTTVLAEHATSFGILPDLQATGAVTTDKLSYGSAEPVTLGITFKNSGVNYVIPQLKARVRIVDASNSQLFSEEKTFTNLLPATGGNFTSAWNTGLSPAGVYTAVLELFAGDTVLTSKTATFSILARPLLKGTLSVDTATVPVGHAFTSTYTIFNQGNSAAAGTARVTLQDPESKAIVASFEQPATIAVNGSLPGSAVFDTTGLALKTYQVALWFYTGTTWQNIAMTTISVRDGIAPVLTAISPQEGVRYTVEVPLSVFASDDASGVGKVEYSLDGIVWKTMPVADPATGRYTTSWPLALTDNGGRTVVFRGTDRAGNTSQPVSVNFVAQGDTTPPALSVSTLSNGSYTNNQVLNISGTITDDSGVKDLLINSVSVPVNNDGTFSYALILQPGANRIMVAGSDRADNHSSDIRTINLDQTTPELKITAPADNSIVGSALVAVTGNVGETSTVTVKLGGAVQTAAMNGGDFSATVTLVSGINTIEVTATDLAGNSSTQKRTVTYDDQNPSLAITVPRQDIRTNQAHLTIQGTASDPYSAAVTVTVAMDGQTYTPTVENGEFSQTLGFTDEKTYSIVVTAINEFGRITTAQRNVIYDITSPALAIDPVKTPTTQTGQTVTGTRETGLTITVTCTTATVGTITYPTDTTWSVALSGMQMGDNLITATSTDVAGNTSNVFATISVTTESTSTFSFAVFGNDSVTMTGGAYVDSYAGSPASHIAGRNRHGNVGTNSRQMCGIRMTGGTRIYGDATVGAGGSPCTSVCMTPGTAVSGVKGTLTTAKSMLPVADPGGVASSGALKLSGNSTKTLTSGNYRFSSINLSGAGKLILNGKITLHVDGNMSLTGGSNLVIASGSVVVYVNGCRIDIHGGSIVNSTLDPANLIIYGSTGVHSVDLSGGTNLHGLIFAPNADIKVSGGNQTYGSIIGKSVDLSGGVSVHYPEGLMK